MESQGCPCSGGWAFPRERFPFVNTLRGIVYCLFLSLPGEPGHLVHIILLSNSLRSVLRDVWEWGTELLRVTVLALWLGRSEGLCPFHKKGCVGRACTGWMPLVAFSKLTPLSVLLVESSLGLVFVSLVSCSIGIPGPVLHTQDIYQGGLSGSGPTS